MKSWRRYATGQPRGPRLRSPGPNRPGAQRRPQHQGGHVRKPVFTLLQQIRSTGFGAQCNAFRRGLGLEKRVDVFDLALPVEEEHAVLESIEQPVL